MAVIWAPSGKQNADGGWGEDFSSCFDREYAARDKLYGSSAFD